MSKNTKTFRGVTRRGLESIYASKTTKELLQVFEKTLREYQELANQPREESLRYKLLDFLKFQVRELNKRGIPATIYN